jgi:hypothetical protein
MSRFNNVARRGEKHHSARLKETDVMEIRRRLDNGAMLRVLAAEYGVGKTTINNIKQHHTWRWLE